MKYVIINLSIAVLLSFVSYKLGWYPAGQEAIAAVGQVQGGDAYAVTRVEAEFWKTFSSVLTYASYVFYGFAAWNLFDAKIFTKQNKQ